MVYYNGNVYRDKITSWYHDACFPAEWFDVSPGGHRQQRHPWNWSPTWGVQTDRWTSPGCAKCGNPVDVPVHWRDETCWTWAEFRDGRDGIEALFAVTYAPYGDEDTCWSLRDVNTPQTPENLARAAQAFHDTYDNAPADPDTETGRRVVQALRMQRFCIIERPARIARTEPERSRALRDVTVCEMSEDDRRILARVVIVGRV
jgi:hypothetical protein